MADPELLEINKPYILKHRPKNTPYLPAEVISMLKPDSRSKYLPILPAPADASSDSDSETAQGFDWNAARTPGRLIPAHDGGAQMLS